MRLNAQAVNTQQVLNELQAATYSTNGVLLIDEYDYLIMDEVYRESPMWGRIDKRLAPGEYTNGADQTAIPTARAVPRRTLTFSATYPTRAFRTPKIVKALTCDTQFGLFDRSVYQQQGRRFGDLQGKDVQDCKVACLKLWNTYVYTGDSSGGAGDQFDGLRLIYASPSTLDHAASIKVGIDEKLVDMTNGTSKAVRPTAIYTNAMVTYMLNMEFLKIGDKLLWAPIRSGPHVFDTPQVATPVGYLPLITDPYNSVVDGTPDTYPTFIVSEDKLSWQYVEVLGTPGADPVMFEIALTNTIDLQYKTIMFGALECLGETYHHTRIDVEYRSTVISPVG